MDTNTLLESQITSTYDRLKPYLDKHDGRFSELTSMCQMCECWYGDNHDYAECKSRPCFRFYLAYEYLKYFNTF